MKKMEFSKKLKMPQVIAGCMRALESGFGGSDYKRFVEACIDMGVTAFDHAPVYGNYEGEAFFGDAVLRKEPALRSRMQLVTKTGIVVPGREGNRTIYYKATREAILKEMDASLQKLGTDHVDLLLVHRPDVLAHPAETAQALEEIIKAGKALEVGVSNYTPAQFKALQSFMDTPLATNQVELSAIMVDNFFNGTTDDAEERRMPLMAWSPLGGGSIFNGRDEQSLRLKGVLVKIAELYGTTIDIILYAWLFTHPLDIAVITGSMKIERIRRAVEASGIHLSHDEWYRILAASRGYDVP